jgi:hypothetical protein
MKRIAELFGQQLKWVQPSALKMQYEFELRSGDELAATLRFRSSFGSFATGESADGCWTFKRVGFWQTRATVRVCDADADIATFKNNTWSGGGTLGLPDGRKFLATTNFWQSKFEFQDESGGTLIQFASSGLINLSGTVEIQPMAVSMPELPWIVMFGWYLTVMMHMDSAVVAAAVPLG